MQNYATFKGHLVIITALPELYNNIIAYKFNSQDQQILAYIFLFLYREVSKVMAKKLLQISIYNMVYKHVSCSHNNTRYNSTYSSYINIAPNNTVTFLLSPIGENMAVAKIPTSQCRTDNWG